MLDKIFHSFKFIAIFVLLQIGVALLNNVKLYAQPQMIWTNAIKAFLLVLASLLNKEFLFFHGLINTFK